MAELSRAGPSRAEPRRTEPSRAGPSRAEPSQAELTSAKVLKMQVSDQRGRCHGSIWGQFQGEPGRNGAELGGAGRTGQERVRT